MKQLVATVIANKHTLKTKAVTVAITSRGWDQKYQRFFKKLTKLKVHTDQLLPVNSKILIAKTKPISPTKSFVFRGFVQ